MALNFEIKTIPHNEHRYETVGDYYEENGKDQIRISDMNNSDYEFLVMIHELIELYLCKKRGIKEGDISAFDIEFEKNREEGNVDEPGDNPNAPYRKEHSFAINIEKQLAIELNVNWADYDNTINNL